MHDVLSRLTIDFKIRDSPAYTIQGVTSQSPFRSNGFWIRFQCVLSSTYMFILCTPQPILAVSFSLARGFYLSSSCFFFFSCLSFIEITRFAELTRDSFKLFNTEFLTSSNVLYLLIILSVFICLQAGLSWSLSYCNSLVLNFFHFHDFNLSLHMTVRSPQSRRLSIILSGNLHI